MKIIQINNESKMPGGIEIMVENTIALLRKRKNDVSLMSFCSAKLGLGVLGKFRAFTSGFYSNSSKKLIRTLIKKKKPDLVHIHNIYPFVSPTVLLECMKARIPIVISIHSYFLTCPALFHYRKQKICELCIGGNEFWCILKNCKNNPFVSLAVAARTAVGRKLKYFDNQKVTLIAVSEFMKNKLTNAGFRAANIRVVPNMVTIPKNTAKPSKNAYVGYVGRISAEKGVNILTSAALMIKNIPVHIAGNGPMLRELMQNASSNVKFFGHINSKILANFYNNARFIIVPSLCYETFGLVIIEAMSHGVAVIASKIGAIPEIIDDGVDGLLFEPGNVKELTKKIKMLWEDHELCDRMGKAGRNKAKCTYNPNVYYNKLYSVYNKAINLNMLTDR
jgi:glycosyltransferase involved in cell wall biosynthesis